MAMSNPNAIVILSVLGGHTQWCSGSTLGGAQETTIGREYNY